VFKCLLKVGVEESIVNAPQTTQKVGSQSTLQSVGNVQLFEPLKGREMSDYTRTLQRVSSSEKRSQ
jgi:hypothetical protein